MKLTVKVGHHALVIGQLCLVFGVEIAQNQLHKLLCSGDVPVLLVESLDGKAAKIGHDGASCTVDSLQDLFGMVADPMFLMVFVFFIGVHQIVDKLGDLFFVFWVLLAKKHGQA